MAPATPGRCIFRGRHAGKRRNNHLLPNCLAVNPDCLAEPMAQEYARLYIAQGEEKAEAFLHAISRQISAKPLSLSARDEELIAFARKQAEQFVRLQRLFNNPAIAACFLCHLAQRKYGITPPGEKSAAESCNGNG